MPSTSKKGDRSGFGHSRGGLTTKIHALLDASGLQINVSLHPGLA
jgi:hypothetical protein